MKKLGSSGLIVPKCAASLALLVLIACPCFGKTSLTLSVGGAYGRESYFP